LATSGDHNLAIDSLEMARRIPDSRLIGLTGGHLLTGHAAQIRATSAEFMTRH